LQPLYEDKKIFVEREEACPFFRENPDDGLFYCTVHLTRPEICREYGCWRLLILDREGNRAGRVMQARHLDSENPRLTEVWSRYIHPIHELDDQEWDTRVAHILRTAGFVVKV